MDREREPDPQLASELRQGAGRDWAAEQAEDERLTELHRRRRMTLADHARELVNRGDRVSVEFGGHTFGGAVTLAGEDYVSVQGPGQVADIKLAEARWSVLPGEPGQAERREGPESFQGLLHEHASAGHVVRLALPGSDLVIGKVDVVGSDHVTVNDVDGRRLVVPTKLILAVVRSSETH